MQVGAFTAIFAVAVFSVPVGVLGDGFGDAISDQMEEIAEMKEKNKAMEEAFKRADSDGSGGISKEELVKCMDELGYEFTAAEVLGMATKADTDGDGSISFEEFTVFVHAELKDEIRVVTEPPQKPAPGMTNSTTSMLYRMMHPHSDYDGDGVADASGYTDGPTSIGPIFEKLIVLLIILNVFAFGKTVNNASTLSLVHSTVLLSGRCRIAEMCVRNVWIGMGNSAGNRRRDQGRSWHVELLPHFRGCICDHLHG